jgi:prolycopene isomerase
LRKLKKLEPSISVLGLYLATDLDVNTLEVPKVTLVSSWDIESAYAAVEEWDFESLSIHIPTVVDESLAPPGEHIVVLQAFTRSGAGNFSPAYKTQFGEKLLDHADTVLPGLREHITFIAGASEEGQLELHRLGPIYGWANSVHQAGPRRLAQKTPISGLYLTGHWTQPGSGIWTVVLSGVNTARHILGMDMSKAIWPLNF